MATRRLTRRGAERRSQLIAVATQLFATKGYHQTSVADVIDGVGVGKGVFYWYFESKEMLFTEILRSAQHDLRRCQHHSIVGIDDPIERIATGLRAAVEWSAEHPELFRLFEFAQTDEQFASAIHRGKVTLARDAVDHIEQAIALGRIPDRDTEQLAWSILGVSTVLTMEFVARRHQDPATVADAVVDFCLRGLDAVGGRDATGVKRDGSEHV